MKTALRKYLAGACSTLVLVGWAASAAAVDGTFHAGATTFANTDHNTVTFKVNPALAEGDQTALLLNFASDGASATPLSEFVSTATIELKYAATSQFSVSYGAGSTGPGIGVPANINLTKIGGSFGKYALTINYNTAAGASALTDVWTLAFTGIAPTNARVSVTMSKGGDLASLATFGVCATGTPTCPPDQTCKGPCPYPPPFCQTHPWDCLREKYWIPKWEIWPPPPDPCFCPDPWKEKFGDEFERTILSFIPLTKDGSQLGAEQSKQIQLTINGGRAIGGLVDVGAGEYAQMLEVRKGEASPRVSAIIAGAAAPAFIAGPVVEAKSPLTMVLGILLVLALALAGYLASRNRNAGTRQG